MYIILWEYNVRVDRESAFEKIYGPDEDWVQLFKQADDYVGTDLIRDVDTPRRYITIDRWTSAEAYDAFHENYREAYEKLDARCESLTEFEKFTGRGEIISST